MTKVAGSGRDTSSGSDRNVEEDVDVEMTSV